MTAKRSVQRADLSTTPTPLSPRSGARTTPIIEPPSLSALTRPASLGPSSVPPPPMPPKRSTTPPPIPPRKPSLPTPPPAPSSLAPASLAPASREGMFTIPDAEPEAEPLNIGEDPEEVRKHKIMRGIRQIMKDEADKICENAIAGKKKELIEGAQVATRVARKALADAQELVGKMEPALDQIRMSDATRELLEQANETLRNSLEEITKASTRLAGSTREARQLIEELDNRKQLLVEINRQIEVGQLVVDGLKKQSAVVRPSGGSGGAWIFLVIVLLVAFTAGGIWLVEGGSLNFLHSSTPARTPLSKIEAPADLPAPEPPSMGDASAPTLPLSKPATATKKSSTPHAAPFSPEQAFDEGAVDQSPAETPLSLASQPTSGIEPGCIKALKTGISGSGTSNDPYTRTAKGRDYSCQEKRDGAPDSPYAQLCTCTWKLHTVH